MKKSIILSLAAALLLGACSGPATLTVEVTNPADVARNQATVEIAWDQVCALEGVTPEQVVVYDAAGSEIPSQVLYCGESEPQALIFQASLESGASDTFTIAVGTRADYPAQAYGRQVPERYDDYAWENNKVAYRLYGPALETAPGEMLVTPGIDVWVKCTDKLVINEWYARGHYHDNDGDGMDCYKVGRTLGGGSTAPFIDGKVYLLPHNYASCRTLDNGPIRTSVELTYAPFSIDGEHTVALTKVITLDANQHFNRMECRYSGDFEELPVAAGFVRHDVKETKTGFGWFAMYEAASDSSDPERDGDIYGAIVWPDSEILPEADGHTLAVKTVRPDEAVTYYAGTGWSQGGIHNLDYWLEKLGEAMAESKTPLQAVVK